MSRLPNIASSHGLAHREELETLATLFVPRLEKLGRFSPVGVTDLPEKYRALLAHHDHMTVTLEAVHESLVDLVVLHETTDAEHYARQSLLVRQTDAVAVQLGVLRIALAGLPPIARQDILEHRSPLGRVLLRNNVLREVELLALWRIEPGDALRHHLKIAEKDPVYGRSARILVDGEPAVEVLEIVQGSQ